MLTHSTPLFANQQIREIRALMTQHVFSHVIASDAYDAENFVCEMLGERLAHWLLTNFDDQSQFVILVGPGGNGVQGLICAKYLLLHERQVDVLASLCDASPKSQIELKRFCAVGGQILAEPPTLNANTKYVIVDALFGIGLNRPITGSDADWILWANQLSVPKVAVDVPSGISTEKEWILDHVVFQADVTLTFFAHKTALWIGDAIQFTGKVILEDLGVALYSPEIIAMRQIIPKALLYVCPANLAWLPTRSKISHKGMFGDVYVIGGQDGMIGAVLLAARAALFCGAGKVFAKFLGLNFPTHDVNYPEIMCGQATMQQNIPDHAICVVGPGMGKNEKTIQLLANLLIQNKPLVLDADALNCLALDANLAKLCYTRSSLTVLTPHPLEAARLLNVSVEFIQKDRLTAAIDIAQRFNAIVVLKGAHSLIVNQSGSCFVNTSGNPALAVGGSGDLLSGMIAALLAQTVVIDDPETHLQIVTFAVWLHGQAADEAATILGGNIGIPPSEFLPQIRQILNRVVNTNI